MAESSGLQPEPETLQAIVTENNDSKARLQDLIAQATLKYSVKDYSAAAELYSQATELKVELNGEMSPENADLLYQYGRCLYHAAVRNSDVLGSKVAGETHREETPKKSKSQKQNGEVSANGLAGEKERVAEEAVTKIVEEKDGAQVSKEDRNVDEKPYFQFTGDENWGSSDDEADAAEGGEEKPDEEEEDDDFVTAYEVLDLARVLLVKRIEELQGTEGKGKATADSEDMKQLKERLADTHDLQAEISLEGERFPTAVIDLQAALSLKKELFPQNSALIAEGHYKLSLALEFSSVTQQSGEDGQSEGGKASHVDEAMRAVAAKEMEAAIASCNLRIQREEARLASDSASSVATGKRKVTRESIDDVKEMVKDMQQRLVELRQPPVSISDPNGTGALDGANPLNGILGSILGETQEAQKARLEEASKSANDLTSLVKRRKPVKTEEQLEDDKSVLKNHGKRKVDLAEEVEEAETAKKAKMEDV
ncbi:Tetratricopeptide-like helical domain [Lasallia pustulata]|uniref:Tetratricopeptide-like helical domain n=1 Tax=Lasallia pustulata TaxID=136370 RepID=A0A1W5CWJ9_9LECA|nr:Tetratricopeptide-like helical domain [Lasallia pustulata]